MPVVTKIKVTSDNKLYAGQFMEGSETTKFKVNSDVLTGELNEVDNSPVKITSEGTIIATQFEEI